MTFKTSYNRLVETYEKSTKRVSSSGKRVEELYIYKTQDIGSFQTLKLMVPNNNNTKQIKAS